MNTNTHVLSSICIEFVPRKNLLPNWEWFLGNKSFPYMIGHQYYELDVTFNCMHHCRHSLHYIYLMSHGIDSLTKRLIVNIQ